MSIEQPKKEEDKSQVNPADLENIENSNTDAKLPEFDEIGTALNDI